MHALDLITATLAKPVSHVVVTTYADGGEHRFEARGAAAAESYAIGERRKIGRELIIRDTGAKRMISSVDVQPI